MCIIPGPIESVSNTKLFVLPNMDKTRQMTFYMNSVRTLDENLMILPVPHPDTIQLHKHKGKRLFSQLSDSVYSTERRWEYIGDSMTRSASLSASYTLPVFDHGSYLVSIANTISDLFRLNRDVFELPAGLDEFFAKHYTSEFGYLCCVLKPEITDYEPLCYSHALHSNGRLFVPTLHYHNHGGRVETEKADWDHLIYSMGTEETANYKFGSEAENKVAWGSFPTEFRKTKDQPVRCAKIVGFQANRDIAFPLV